jgi:hypothetical protein
VGRGGSCAASKIAVDIYGESQRDNENVEQHARPDQIHCCHVNSIIKRSDISVWPAIWARGGSKGLLEDTILARTDTYDSRNHAEEGHRVGFAPNFLSCHTPDGTPVTPMSYVHNMRRTCHFYYQTVIIHAAQIPSTLFFFVIST